MILQLDLETHKTLGDVRAFLEGNPEGSTLAPSQEQAYSHLERVLRRFAYWRLGKPAKGLLRRDLERTTGLSPAQLTRLIRRYCQEGQLVDRRGGPGQPFPTKYTREDVLLLAETDELHGSLSGPATLAILKRQWQVFGDARFERLAGLSNGHLYNLRRSRTYQRRFASKQATQPSKVSIGERRRPQPEGQPGYLRGRFGASGRLRQGQGCLSHQRGRRGDAESVRGQCGADRGELPAAGAGGPAGGLPVRNPRLACR